jgi:hypothetical protein
MFNPDTSPQSKFFLQAIEAAAASLGLQVIAAPVRATADIEPALGDVGLPGALFGGSGPDEACGES